MRQINQKNQVTLPAHLLKSLGVKSGDFIEVELKGSNLILKPKRVEDVFTKADWKALDELVTRQVKAKEFTEYSSPEKARSHIKK